MKPTPDQLEDNLSSWKHQRFLNNSLLSLRFLYKTVWIQVMTEGTDDYDRTSPRSVNKDVGNVTGAVVMGQSTRNNGREESEGRKEEERSASH